MHKQQLEPQIAQKKSRGENCDAKLKNEVSPHVLPKISQEFSTNLTLMSHVFSMARTPPPVPTAGPCPPTWPVEVQNWKVFQTGHMAVYQHFSKVMPVESQSTVM